MLDRVYYIIRWGLALLVSWTKAVESPRMWNERNSASSTLFISATQANHTGDAGLSPDVIKGNK